MDIDNIPPGEDFVTVLEKQVAACDVLLAVNGRGWVTATERGFMQDDAEAVKWYRKAAEHGNAKARLELISITSASRAAGVARLIRLRRHE